VPVAVYSAKKQYLADVLPAWPAGAVAAVSYAEACSILRRHAPLCVCDEPSDSAFTAVPVPVLEAAIRHTLRQLAAQGITYGANSWDCENFQRELCQTLAKMARRAGLFVSPLTGMLKAQLLHKWADVLPGGWHALAVAWTPEGWRVIESQNGQHIALELYPNGPTITRLSGC